MENELERRVGLWRLGLTLLNEMKNSLELPNKTVAEKCQRKHAEYFKDHNSYDYR